MNPKDLEFFNNIASSWDSIIEVNDDKIGHILDIAGIKPGDEILDVGTGTGVLIPYLIERIGEKGEIDALDISDNMLEQARIKFANIHNINFLNIDVEEDLIDKKYDCIMMYCMYPHLTRGEDTLEWLVKVNLKQNGRIVIAFPESKESINGIHHHNDGTVHSNHLTDGNMFRARLAVMGLNVDYVEDNDDYYIIVIVKN